MVDDIQVLIDVANPSSENRKFEGVAGEDWERPDSRNNV